MKGEEYMLVGKNSGVGRITTERLRQVDVEGWTPEHDDQHAHGELTQAAVCYAHYAWRTLAYPNEQPFSISPSQIWPRWDTKWWKPSPDPIRNLEKAGALIAAEIDRLKRKADRDELAS